MLTHLSLFPGSAGLIWLPSGPDLQPSGSANLPITRQRCWRSTGRTCRDGVMSGR
nr:MAG TPA: hypothetical protein [Caudoviricetes sp.]